MDIHSWTCTHVMTVEQLAKLFKSSDKGLSRRKNSLRVCLDSVF